MLGLGGPDLHLGEDRAQLGAYTSDGATSAEAGAEAIDGDAGRAHIGKDLRGRAIDMGRQVVAVHELLGHEHARVVGGHPLGEGDALPNAGADVPLVMDADHLGPVMLHDAPALHRAGVRHDDAGRVALHGRHEREPHALVAAGGLHDNGIGAKLAALLGALDHLQRRTRLHRSAHVHRFELHEHLGVQNVIADHSFPSPSGSSFSTTDSSIAPDSLCRPLPETPKPRPEGRSTSPHALPKSSNK